MKKNILVICSDEHNTRLCGYKGAKYVKTPNLDRLAAEGTVFENAYCNSPVCTPSRMSFITGQYVHQIKNWFIEVPLPEDIMTWPRELSEHGIETTMIGKMDFCGAYQSGGFDKYKIWFRRPAFEEYPRTSPFEMRLKGYTLYSHWEHIEHSGIRPENTPILEEEDGHEDTIGFYGHDVRVRDAAIQYIREKGQKRDDEPWTLYVGLLYPHWPFFVPEKYFNLYYPDKVEVPFDAEFPNKRLHPAVYRYQETLYPENMTSEHLKRTLAAYYGMITAMDDMIGEIIQELKAQGLYEDTYIIYTSDHGDAAGEHGMFYKKTSYEGSVGIPLIIKGPGISKGQRITENVSLIDLYPTVLHMAGIKEQKALPGKSLLGMAQRLKGDKERIIFSEYHGSSFMQSWYMLKQGSLKYTHYDEEGATLFDLEKDPCEMFDLAKDPAYGDIIYEFERILEKEYHIKDISRNAKQDLGLLSEDGEDYTKTLTAEQLLEGRKTGKFKEECRKVPDIDHKTHRFYGEH